MNDATQNSQPHLYEKLLGETARVTWAELERLFGAGKVVKVSSDLNLVAVGEAFAQDNADLLKSWMQKDLVGLLDDPTALRWSQEEKPHLWAVVIRPWVLVQERIA